MNHDKLFATTKFQPQLERLVETENRNYRRIGQLCQRFCRRVRGEEIGAAYHGSRHETMDS